ncbi:hypothetical protein Tco_0064934 [Tanacetum coccineum]
MTGSDHALPSTPLSEKPSLVTHHHLLTRVPVKLDLDNWNFGSWEFFFKQSCASYEVDKYLRSPTTDSSTSVSAPMYTFSPMMVANSRKHHCRVRSYTREVLVISTNLDIQKNHYPLDFRNRRGDEARIKNTWYNQGLVNECHRRTLKILLRL